VRGRVRWALLGLGVAVVVAAAVVVARTAQRPAAGAPLVAVAEVPLPGDGSRWDYASLDPARGLLFAAHLGAGEVVEVDVRGHAVVRVIGGLPEVHGVLVVPELHRVFATATGQNTLVALDEDTGAVVWRAPTGAYPDGVAHDPRRGRVWTTNETAGSETVVDAATGAVVGSVDLGGEVGNVAYDPIGDRVLVAVQGRGDLAVLDPRTLAVTRRVALPGCAHPHGLALDPPHALVFVGCDRNATVAAVDLNSGQVTGTARVGDEPDVLAFDPDPGRLWVAAESGDVSVLTSRDHTVRLAGTGHLADGAHVVAVDPGSHHGYFPVPGDGRPVLLERAATS
jgi:DNA-binding beta-propeller fold protein YncE